MENYEKKYKKALGWMQSLYTGLHGKTREEAETYFPELKESEDERIRKGLIKGLSAMRDIHHHQTFSDDAINIDDAIAWLEKQGEKKPTDKIESKFKVGDIIKYVGEREEFSKEKYTIKEILDDCYLTIDDVYIPFKFEDYYILVNQNYTWSEEDSERLLRIHQFIWANRKGDTDEIYQQEQDADWLMTLKSQPKQEWSEEDEKMLSFIDAILEYAYNNNSRGFGISCIDLKMWLKSLKPRWKPTEEQMEALKYFISFHKPQANAAVEGWKEFNNLESLYNDLKSL